MLKTPTPTPIKSKVHPLSYLYDEAQIKAGRIEATRLLLMVEPSTLADSPSLDETAREANRLTLMRIAIETAFLQLYTSRGVGASRSYWDISQEAKDLLTNYPEAKALADFDVIEEGLAIREKKVSLSPDDPNYARKDDCRYFQIWAHEISSFTFLSLDRHRKVIEAKRAALINYIYGWMLKAAGGQPRDYQASHLPVTKITPSAETLKINFAGLVKVLAYLNNYSPPLLYTLIKKQLVEPPSGLPFNIFIPF